MFFLKRKTKRVGFDVYIELHSFFKKNSTPHTHTHNNRRLKTSVSIDTCVYVIYNRYMFFGL